eukprot:2646901-Rhodomonas_salina.1
MRSRSRDRGGCWGSACTLASPPPSRPCPPSAAPPPTLVSAPQADPPSTPTRPSYSGGEAGG